MSTQDYMADAVTALRKAKDASFVIMISTPDSPTFDTHVELSKDMDRADVRRVLVDIAGRLEE